MSSFRFKNLEIWQMARILVKDVYKTTRAFPAEERYALVDQLRRAAVSVPSNIAEGSARKSAADFVHFLVMARGSLAELLTQLILAQDLEYLADVARLEQDIESIVVKINALIASLNSKK
jgi:four helix bundle protein